MVSLHIPEDNYSASFKEYFGLIDIIYPTNFDYHNIENYYHNSNIIVLIIESMCIGIIMPSHIAYKFKYISGCVQHNDVEYLFDNKEGIKIIRINNEWDTRKWSYTKIIKFYSYLYEIENKSCDEIEFEIDKLNLSKFGASKIDIEFLNSLCWNSGLND